MKVGDQIRQIRRESGKTLEDVAFCAGTDAGNLSRIERGQQACSADMLARIASALETPVSTLFQPASRITPVGRERTPPKRAKPPLDEDLQMRFEGLTPDNRELALAFIQLLARRQSMPKITPPEPGLTRSEADQENA